MGGNMAEADEFDQVMQSVEDGTYRPTPSAGMETFPVSHPHTHTHTHTLTHTLKHTNSHTHMHTCTHTCHCNATIKQSV